MPPTPTPAMIPNTTPSCRRTAAPILLALAATLLTSAQQAGGSPVKIFIMAGQSNTQGHGEISPATTPGTLSYIVDPANDPGGDYQFLRDGAGWNVRDDVLIHYQRDVVLGSGVREGGLTVGYGANSSNVTIGPELGFGNALGDIHESRILLIKTCWGGKSLSVDFRPPTSGWTVDPPVAAGDQGFFYQKILEIVSDVTANIASHVPGYSGEGYEIAGFAWHQGWNDRVKDEFSDEYATNMANFINDIRSSEHGLGVPNLPFVIATTGMNGGSTYTTVEEAQLAMANPAVHPEFAGNVAVVDTRQPYEGLDFWQPVASSPRDQVEHWNRNARTYLHIGLAMGDAMSTLVPGRCPSRLRATGGPGGVTLNWQNGSETPTSVQILRAGGEIVAALAGANTAYTDTTAQPGLLDYELVFTMPGGPCDPLTVTYNAGITGLEAYRTQGSVRLDWTNNLGYTGIEVSRDGVVIEPALAGGETGYTDTSPPASGWVTYRVVPLNGSSTPAEVQIDLSAGAGNAVVYEPFDIANPADPLNGKAAGYGLTGNWTVSYGAAADMVIGSGSLNYGVMPAGVGNHVLLATSTDNATGYKATPGPALTAPGTGLMDDGDELWFSFIMQNPTDTSSYVNNRLMFYLGSQDANPASRDMLSAGHGLGVEITPTGNGGGKPRVRGIAWEGATTETLGTRYEFPNGPSYPGTTTLIVGKITWGATSDTIDIYAPDTALNLGDPLAVSGTPITLAANVDQSLIDRLYIGGKKDSPIIDEIRIGATYADVISGGGTGGPTEADNAVSIADFSNSIGFDPTGGTGGIGQASGSFAGFEGGSYTVEWSPDLMPPWTPVDGTWPVAGTGTSGTAGVQIPWSHDTTATKAFFRLKIE